MNAQARANAWGIHRRYLAPMCSIRRTGIYKQSKEIDVFSRIRWGDIPFWARRIVSAWIRASALITDKEIGRRCVEIPRSYILGTAVILRRCGSEMCLLPGSTDLGDFECDIDPDLRQRGSEYRRIRSAIPYHIPMGRGCETRAFP